MTLELRIISQYIEYTVQCYEKFNVRIYNCFFDFSQEEFSCKVDWILFSIHSWMITEKWAEQLKFFIIKYFITSFSSILSLEPGLNYTYHLDACFTFQPGWWYLYIIDCTPWCSFYHERIDLCTNLRYLIDRPSQTFHTI